MLRRATCLGLQPIQGSKAIRRPQVACCRTVAMLTRRGYPSIWDAIRGFSSRSLGRSKQCCSFLGLRRYGSIGGEGRSRKRWHSGWWSWFVKERFRGVTRKHVACATAVFLWDNERITHQDVYKCLCQYERRVGKKCFTQTKDTNYDDVTGEVGGVGSCLEQAEEHSLEQGSGERSVSPLRDEAESAPSAQSTHGSPDILPCSGEGGAHAPKSTSPCLDESTEAVSLTIGRESSVISGSKKTLVSQSINQPESTDSDERLHQPQQGSLDPSPEKVKEGTPGIELSSKSQVGCQDSATFVSLASSSVQHSSECPEQISEINCSVTPSQYSSESQEQVSRSNSSNVSAQSQQTVLDSTASLAVVTAPSQHCFSEAHEQVQETAPLPSSHAVTPAHHATQGQKPVVDSSLSGKNVADGITTTGKDEEQEAVVHPSLDRNTRSEGKNREGSLGATLEGWNQIVQLPNCKVYQKLYKDTGLFQYKVIGSYDDITARDFIDVQANNEERKEWDTYALKLETVDRDPQTGSEVVHWVSKFPYPLASREYVFVRRVWFSDKDDAIVLINRSVDHPSVRTPWCQVRIKTYFSEMVIKPFTFIDQLGFDYELTYFDNPGTYLPSSATNWVARSAMPDFLSKIHNAALRKKDQCIDQLQKNVA